MQTAAIYSPDCPLKYARIRVAEPQAEPFASSGITRTAVTGRRRKTSQQICKVLRSIPRSDRSAPLLPICLMPIGRR